MVDGWMDGWMDGTTRSTMDDAIVVVGKPTRGRGRWKTTEGGKGPVAGGRAGGAFGTSHPPDAVVGSRGGW